MDSAFKGTVFEPYDMLTTHTHALVIHVNPDINNSPVLQQGKRSKTEMGLLSKQVMAVFRQKFPMEIHISALPVEGFLILGMGLNLTENDLGTQEDDFLNRLQLELTQIHTQIYQALKLYIEISVSAIHIHNQNVFDAYQEAFSVAVHRPFFQGRDAVILHRDFQQGLNPIAMETKRNLEKQWFTLMEARNFQDAEPILLELVDLRASAPQTITSLTQELLSRLSFFTYQLCDLIELPSGTQEMLLRQVDLIRSAKNTQQLHNQIHQIYAAMEKIANMGTKPNELGWAKRISSYIQTNYANPALNAEQISRQFGLHPAYISDIFHKGTGIKLLDYIHITRIEHIRQLLKQTDMSLTDIAQKTGYYDRYSMSRVFRRYVGVCPSEYRRN